MGLLLSNLELVKGQHMLSCTRYHETTQGGGKNMSLAFMEALKICGLVVALALFAKTLLFKF
ncbi:hypothetical protein RJ639_013109 [Escallonia herrerae]|uniref:Uncharacterized protein n=1 Tax=Escallonia herrerae TaxID=1293975 RepID=A0AA88VF27_9ASTE|nr:hypothetical protein RJ639_013109 [Escallonia herrerae]